jgi:hypothetical protein
MRKVAVPEEIKCTARNLLKVATLAPVAAVPAAAAEAPASPSAALLDDTLRPFLARYNLPALAAAVVLNGTVIATGAVGTRRAGGPPITVNDGSTLDWRPRRTKRMSLFPREHGADARLMRRSRRKPVLWRR